MPGVTNDKPEIAGAICGPPPRNVQEETNGHVEELPQPRQPSNLQGLLRFAMEATKAEDAPVEPTFTQMDQERKSFLEAALKSMTVDVIEILQEQIRILKKVLDVKATDDASEYSNAIETILEHVDDIDISNDFLKIGGGEILRPCLTCEHPQIRAGGCQLLAELCQNNSYCQQYVVSGEYVPLVINILENDQDEQVILKALYAISSIVRDNNDAFGQLINYRGLDAFKKILQRKEEKSIIKITFLLGALCRNQPDIKSRLQFLEYLPILISLLSGVRNPSQEHVLSLLVSLIEESSTAQAECKHPRHNLKEILQDYLSSIKNKEECLEEEQYCKRLLHLLFGVN